MPTLEWIGKNKVINHHQEVPYRVLNKKYTYNAEESENMIIRGDNLEALKSLLPQYEGRIKCIYIDPPYNTAHSTNANQRWVYNDNVDDPKIRAWLGKVVGDEGEDLSRHDKWLCMMYPRLKLLQKLLSYDGIIFISIGEDEITTLKIICDEIFGSNNRCGIISRVMKSGGNKGKFFSPNIDYILVYCKNNNFVNGFKQPLDEKIIKKLYTGIETNGPRKGQRYRPFGLYQSSLDERPNQRYYIECPDGSYAIPPGISMPAIISDGEKVLPEPGDGCWRWSLERYLDEKEKGSLLFKHSDGVLIQPDGSPSEWNVYTKIWLDDREEEGQTPTNLISVYENRLSAKELSALNINFDFAKPSKLIEYLIKISTTDKDAIILDSFGGSGSTAQAVLNLNKEDGGNRKFIVIEMMDYAETLTAERVKKAISGYNVDSEHLLYDKKLTLKDLENGSKLIEKANEIYKEAQSEYSSVKKPKIVDGHLQVIATNKAVNKTHGLGGDFSFYDLGEPLLIGSNQLNENIDIDQIRNYVWYMETKQPAFIISREDNDYYLGKYNDNAYYFYYEKNHVTTLNNAFLATIQTKADSYVIYADKCVYSEEALTKMNITFKKIPRDISRL